MLPGIAATAAAAILVSAAAASWEFEDVVSPITDQHRGIASAEVAGDLLMVKCDAPGRRSMYVAVEPNLFVGTTGSDWISYRVDDDPPVRMIWRYGIRNANTRGSGDAEKVIQAIASAKSKFAIQIMDFDQQPHTLVVPAAGAREAISQAIRACGADLQLAPAPG